VLDVIRNARDILKRKAAPDTLGVVAPDDTHLTITLAAPKPLSPGLLAHSEHLSRSQAPHWNSPRRRVTTRYVIEWRVCTQGVGSRFASIGDPQPLTIGMTRRTRLDAVRYIPIDDENSELMRFRAADLDITSTIPRARLEEMKSLYPGQVHGVPVLRTEFYGPEFGARAIQEQSQTPARALDGPSDRERIVQLILHGAAVPAYGWVPRHSELHPAVIRLPHDADGRPNRRGGGRLYREARYFACEPPAV